uniref:Uncharacterized protein n=1 Tax=viral metagenome TaxID=1070528 RepID=A0A6C0JEB6_9ZZZZ
MQKQLQPHLQNLSLVDKQEVISRFPNIKLCYDNIIHNKVEIRKITINYDICSAIPCGKKCFAWFTQLHGKNVCLILELINRKQINDIKIYNCVFNKELIYGNHGTILYGTVFHFSQNPFFTVEDIFYHKDNDVTNANWSNKFNILTKIFENNIKQISYNKTFIVFGLPLMAKDSDELKRIIEEDVQYKIYNIQFRSFNKANTMDSVLLCDINNVVKIVPPIIKAESLPVSLPAPLPQPEPTQLTRPSQQIKNTQPNTMKIIPKDIIFRVKADIQNDIYHLYCLENNVEVFYNIAYIPDYKTSIMMNKLFRNIKENDNLDLLEESDDEEEFQNENIDRFVDMNKTLLMICKFNYKFKKWYPIKEFLGQNALPIDKKELNDREKPNYIQPKQYNNQYSNQYEKKRFINNNNNRKTTYKR